MKNHGAYYGPGNTVIAFTLKVDKTTINVTEVTWLHKEL